MDGRYVISSHDIPNSDENKTSIKELPTHKPLIIPRQTKALVCGIVNWHTHVVLLRSSTCLHLLIFME